MPDKCPGGGGGGWMSGLGIDGPINPATIGRVK